MTKVFSASESDAAVKVASLSKKFPNGTLAVDNVSFVVPRGQIVAVLGLSGSGKSTLMRMLNGLHTPTSGSAYVLGTDISKTSSKELRLLRREIGFIFQQFGLVGRMTCIENVLTGALGRLRGPRLGVRMYPVALRREALNHLERVGLLDQAFQRADTLSGGQMQRVAIARSLMQHPKVLLADEPVASLDPESSAQILELMASLAREENMTVLCSLHQVELAKGWSDRIIGLRSGKVVLDAMSQAISMDTVMALYKNDDKEDLAKNVFSSHKLDQMV
ncbi:MAG: phosphonate ABC transporter ATP-binding protein [Actinomycetes bacterium]